MQFLSQNTLSVLSNGNSGAAKTIDWSRANRQNLTLTANTTLTFTSPGGDAILSLKLTQDATGSRTVTWPAAVKWPSGIAVTLTTTANAIDFVTLVFDNTAGHYYAQSVKDFR